MWGFKEVKEVHFFFRDCFRQGHSSVKIKKGGSLCVLLIMENFAQVERVVVSLQNRNFVGVLTRSSIMAHHCRGEW